MMNHRSIYPNIVLLFSSGMEYISLINEWIKIISASINKFGILCKKAKWLKSSAKNTWKKPIGRFLFQKTFNDTGHVTAMISHCSVKWRCTGGSVCLLLFVCWALKPDGELFWCWWGKPHHRTNTLSPSPLPAVQRTSESARVWGLVWQLCCRPPQEHALPALSSCESNTQSSGNTLFACPRDTMCSLPFTDSFALNIWIFFKYLQTEKEVVSMLHISFEWAFSCQTGL